ncbi:hypothetical protein GCM10011363_36250 [Marivita lacus]|uniref:site-specific DNA-methyltransferase (adenine-specific) n=1 Tax=Marivita lacus TaxID=1323742 RepID=A0ABQ1L0I9_9RHOB|nr:BREX-1 system adenine-specific DNA-methyltransferase PglX [Marivita lacus]GGC16572.1 hypothetical protein GCM10011363_36250 [Marivita lacus]
MAFDQSTRNRLQRFVTDVRRTLEEEFTRQLQNDYGLDPISGTASPLESLRHINDQQRETARILRDTLAHYCASADTDTKAGLDRIVREQAFTVLNRLAALRMAEARGLLMESVGNGYQAKGFQLYIRLAGTGLGETGDAYRIYLQSVFDELSQDLPGLFDRFSPQGRLFPRESALIQVLTLINHGEIEPLWAEDETIGWIYQYFNSKEERKKMRDASQAPRNSRELAVRNQFFTPRYVVEFLVDNTLGRLWFNWTGGQTGLRDRCQYLLVKPDEQPEPAKRLRDPRTIKLLDPACGSMHFGLYAFDLFLEIYREAWAWEQTHGPGCLDTETGGSADLKPLSQTYADQDTFLHDVPRLIIEHNIYGVDIDPRAAQIASLALWLRAQRAWHEAGVKAKDRPQVGRGHVVAAVAPPAEVDLRKRFMEELDPLDAELFEKTLFLLKGLPELGVLLQVENELPALVRTVFGEHGELFRETDTDQWQKAEARLREALAEFTSSANTSYQDRLFAGDALQGLRLVDLSDLQFDVAVMNPPFGAPPPTYSSYGAAYSISNLYTAFFDRLSSMGIPFIGAITDRTFVVQPTFEAFRECLINSQTPISALADLGWGVLDANVQVCAFATGPNPIEMCAFVDAREVEDKASAILPQSNQWLWRTRETFGRLPKQVLAYSIPNEILELYRACDPLDAMSVLPRGLGSNKAERTFRAWVEVLPEDTGPDGRWVCLANGGDFSPFWREDLGVADWRATNGFQWTDMTSSDPWRPYDQSGTDQYFLKGLSFPKQSSRFHVSPLPSGYVPTREGKAVLLDSENDLLPMIAILNSGLIGSIVRDTCGLHKQGKAIGSIPIPKFDVEKKIFLGERAQKIAIRTRRTHFSDESSRYFILPSEINPLYEEVDSDEIERLVAEIEKTVRTAISLSAEVEQWLDDPALPVPYVPSSEDTRMWAAGVVFGRFDFRLATGEREIPREPDLFGEVPSTSPGMLPSGAEQYHPYFGILVDDQGHRHDLARLIEEVLALVAVPVPADVRRWMQRDFFKSHLAKYSIARRKAPIYWPVSTSSGSYTLWLYYPSLTDQTLFSAVNDFIEPKLKQVGQDVAALRSIGSARSRDDEKTFEALQTLELELIELRDTLLTIAPTYRPNHDDGVQITAAPLWQLFRHKPWQKILKDTWAKLEKGDYDWAHLALAYWPDRVREKCKTDKSLAIAHDLEHLYVEPDPKPTKARGRKKNG